MRPRALAASVLTLAVVAALQAPASGGVQVELTRTAGADRYTTAVAVADETPTDGGFRAILASGRDFPDGLAATALAQNNRGRLLLTEPDRLPDPVRAAILRYKPIAVWIVGGTKAISTAVEEQLRSDGFEVERFAGATRYETAATVYNSMSDSGSDGPPTRVVVTTGENFPDAVAAGQLLRAAGLLLTQRDTLPAPSREILGRAISEVWIIGGTAAVSSDVERQIVELCQGGVEPKRFCKVLRFGGQNRQETAAAIAEFSTSSGGVPRQDFTAVIVRGDAFPDALVAGNLAATENSVMLLTQSPTVLSDAAEGYLRQHREGITRVRVIGDETAVSQAVAEQARDAATLM